MSSSDSMDSQSSSAAPSPEVTSDEDMVGLHTHTTTTASKESSSDRRKSQDETDSQASDDDADQDGSDDSQEHVAGSNCLPMFINDRIPFQIPMWLEITLKLIFVLGCLYFFLVGLSLLGTSFKMFGSESSNEMLNRVSNPIAGVMVGILATVLVQSSSTSTSIVVGLVAADILTVSAAIPIIMGANIGTSVTNTLVSINHIGNREEFSRAFAGATVHDFFNILSVATLLPLELVSGYLAALSGAIADGISGDSETFKSPIKVIVSPVTDSIVKLNKTAIKEEEYDDMIEGGWFKDSDIAPAAAGVITLFVSLIFLCLGLYLLVRTLRSLLATHFRPALEKWMASPYINKWWFGYLSIGIGTLLTIAVQSSSVTTSAITPLVGIGIITVDQMYPVTLGANIGTTITAMLAAVASGKTDAMQVAFAHLFFNLSGILIWYPIPFMRAVPLFFAHQLAAAVHKRRWFAFAYIGVVFFGIPLLLYLLSLGGPAVFWPFFTIFFLMLIVFITVLVLRHKKPQFLERFYEHDKYGYMFRRTCGNIDFNAVKDEEVGMAKDASGSGSTSSTTQTSSEED